MKRTITHILLSMLVAVSARAAGLKISSAEPTGCFQNAILGVIPTTASNNFALPDVSGAGSISSSADGDIPTFSFPPLIYGYGYTINMSHMSSAVSHCITLIVHFGAPEGCDSLTVWGNPSDIQSATLAAFGDITFVFHGGCLEPGQAAINFSMFTEAVPKTGVVTVIDDYTDPQTGMPTEVRTNVPAIVPDIPPDPPIWYYAPQPVQLPFTLFQGALAYNPANGGSNEPSGFLNGPYDLAMQLVDSTSNSYAASRSATQTVQVVNGLFTVPLPFEPVTMDDGSERWLNISVRPSGLPAVQFTPLAPLPLVPAPQAYYAYTAGVVADLTPGQAVTSLNGLTDAVNLQAGVGIIFDTNGNSIIIAAQPGVGSDRNIKTDFMAVNPQAILARLAALPIQSWRYTNEVAGVRHVGPMAQDFKTEFGLGNDDKFIGFVDEEGVALAAIQGLNQKLEAQAKEKDAEIQDLKQRMEKLEQLVNSNQGNIGNPK